MMKRRILFYVDLEKIKLLAKKKVDLSLLRDAQTKTIRIMSKLFKTNMKKIA